MCACACVVCRCTCISAHVEIGIGFVPHPLALGLHCSIVCVCESAWCVFVLIWPTCTCRHAHVCGCTARVWESEWGRGLRLPLCLRQLPASDPQAYVTSTLSHRAISVALPPLYFWSKVLSLNPVLTDLAQLSALGELQGFTRALGAPMYRCMPPCLASHKCWLPNSGFTLLTNTSPHPWEVPSTHTI